MSVVEWERFSAEGSAHAWSPDDALARLESSREGLDEQEADSRRASVGANTLRGSPPRSVWAILHAQVRSVIVLLLIGAAGIAATIGDVLDAVAIAAVLVINVTIGFVTELRARRAMHALLRLQAPQAVVVRQGEPREIDASELVPGDLIALEAGQFVPADARVIETTDLRMTEASLTGESESVLKTVDAVDQETPLVERTGMVYQGTTVADGRGRALVVATGTHTELARVGELAGRVRDERTPLEQRLDALGHRLLWLALAAGALVVLAAGGRGLSLSERLQTGIALAIAAVPEGLPAVATIALAIGARRMARHNALMRRLAAAESLGSVTVVCADKTGTLTAGRMSVTVLALSDRRLDVDGAPHSGTSTLTEGERPVDVTTDDDVREALEIGLLANDARLSDEGDPPAILGDPTEGALLLAGRAAGLDYARLTDEHPRVAEVPFSSERMLMATFHRGKQGPTVCVKGAPTRVLDRCTRVRTTGGDAALDEAGRERLLALNQELAASGLRVLALARGSAREGALDESGLQDLTFVGLVGMLDPPAAGVRETIAAFHDAGIRTVMITGDQEETARAIARDLGILDQEGTVLDGRALARLPANALSGQLAHVSAFSRVSPEEKLAIVDGFQQRGDVVAMLGDGVNDAPALRKADVGVAMGHRGTDVAKEAADVVLQDDRFATIGAAVEQGRIIFDNILKFTFYLFSCNLAEVLAVVAASAAGWPLPLLPLQILWLNIVTDTFPALSLAVEPGEPRVMRRPPRDPQEAIFSAPFLRAIVGYGALITLVTLAAFYIALDGAEVASPRALTMSFMTLALAQTFHLGTARSTGPVVQSHRALANSAALGAVALVLGLQALAVHFAPLAQVLGTVPLAARDWATCAGLALVPAIIGQAIRWRAAQQATGTLQGA